MPKDFKCPVHQSRLQPLQKLPGEQQTMLGEGSQCISGACKNFRKSLVYSWEALIHTLSLLVLEHLGTQLLITIPASPRPHPCLPQCGCDRWSQEWVSWLENQKNPQSSGT